MAKSKKHLYEFGPFLVDPAEHRLLHEGRPVQLTPKGFDLLLVLLRHNGRLLEKDELMKGLWPDSFVEEGNLSFNVSTLRKALSREQNGQHYIETVPKRGYRFVASVRELTGEAAAQVEERLLQAQAVTTEKSKSDARDQQAQVAPILLRKPRTLPQWTLWAALVVLVVVAAGTVFLRHRAHLRWAKESVVRVEALARSKRFFEAFDLATTIQRYLPNEPTIARLLPEISDLLLVSTDPPGARVYLRRFSRDGAGNFPPRQFIGQTPIRNLLVARGGHLMYIEKDGYATIERTISSSLIRAVNALGARSVIPIEQKLIETTKVPARMVFVPGGSYELVSYGRPTQTVAKLGAYFIDKFEVTNREY
jgi:DNA-binding winged helix-turn-helix (wHTH) protein